MRVMIYRSQMLRKYCALSIWVFETHSSQTSKELLDGKMVQVRSAIIVQLRQTLEIITTELYSIDFESTATYRQIAKTADAGTAVLLYCAQSSR